MSFRLFVVIVIAAGILVFLAVTGLLIYILIRNLREDERNRRERDERATVYSPDSDRRGE